MAKQRILWDKTRKNKRYYPTINSITWEILKEMYHEKLMQTKQTKKTKPLF